VADAGSSELAEVGGGEERGEGDAGRPSEDNDLVAVVSVFGGNCAARLLADRQSACDPLLTCAGLPVLVVADHLVALL
jgi:hypothetical protein